MGPMFDFTEANIPAFDPASSSLLMGIGGNLAALDSDPDDDRAYRFVMNDTDLLDVMQNGSAKSKNFGLLRATALAYVQHDPGRTTEGAHYVHGPFLEAFNTISKPTASNFQAPASMEFRDPTTARIVDFDQRQERPLYLFDDKEKVTLVRLLALLNDQTVVYGTELGWSDIFGEDGGFAHYRDLSSEIYGDLALTPYSEPAEISDAEAPDAPTALDNIDSISAPTDITPGTGVAPTTTAPTAPTGVTVGTAPLISYGAGEVDGGAEGGTISTPTGVTGTYDASGAAATFDESDISEEDLDVEVLKATLLETDLLADIGTLLEGVVTVTPGTVGSLEEPGAATTATTDIDPDFTPADAHEPWTTDAFNATSRFPELPTLSHTPVLQTATDAITAAVAAYTARAEIRYAAEAAALEASLSAGRCVFTSVFDDARANLTALKQLEIAEYDKALRVHQAEMNHQAAVRHQELLLQQSTSEGGLQLEYRKAVASFVERSNDLLVRDSQFHADLLARFGIAKAENYLRAALADTEAETRYNLQFMEQALRAVLADADGETTAAVAGANFATQAKISAIDNRAKLQAQYADLVVRAAMATKDRVLQQALANLQSDTQTGIATAENSTRASIASEENTLRQDIATADFLVRAALAQAENTVRASLANYEGSVRLAVSNADALTRASIAAGDLSVRGSIAGADNMTRANIANASNLLQAAVSIADNATRISMANADATTRTNLANAENELRSSIATAEHKLRVMELQGRYTLAELENQMRTELANSEIERLNIDNIRKQEIDENERIMGELRLRADMAKAFYDVTLGWMNAKTSNASALSSIITSGMQQNVVQTQLNRQFDLNAEKQRWDIVAQRSGLVASSAELKWKAMIQNMMVIKEACNTVGLTPAGTEHHPSAFSNTNDTISSIANMASGGLNLLSLLG